MGCDVHLVAEVKIRGDWHTYAVLNPTRWYSAFAKLAGVRVDDIEPIAKPRGLPGDISPVANAAYLDAGDNYWLHHVSWLSSGEVEAFREWMMSQGGDVCDWLAGISDGHGGVYLFRNCWVRESLPEYVDDFRWLFWFDN